MKTQQPTEEVEATNFLCCKKCNCTNIAVVKKGFSGKKAVHGYLIATAIGGFLIYCGFVQKIDLLDLYIVASVAGVGCFLSLLAGTINMNDIYSICLRCGDKVIIAKADNILYEAPEEQKENG